MGVYRPQVGELQVNARLSFPNFLEQSRIFLNIYLNEMLQQGVGVDESSAAVPERDLAPLSVRSAFQAEGDKPLHGNLRLTAYEVHKKSGVNAEANVQNAVAGACEKEIRVDSVRISAERNFQRLNRVHAGKYA